MREIKFRAWDNQEREMFFPSRIDFNCDGANIMCGRTYCNNDLEFDWYGESETLMQYTGLHDKNGVEVYEGDIMKLPDSDFIFVVEYQDNAFVLSSDRVDFKSKGYFTEREVIGNIYENPELLKER